MSIINTIILKVASPCNLNCTYCYEYQDDEWKNMPTYISNETLDLLSRRITEYVEEFNLPRFYINAHGGEPMLLGADGLDNLFSRIRKNIPKSVQLQFGMQTNAILATNEIINVLKKHKVSIGISIDGDENANIYRVDHGDNPAFNKIIKGINILKDNGAFISGGLCVINPDSNAESTICFLNNLSLTPIDLLQPYGTYDNLPINNGSGGKLGLWWIEAFKAWALNKDLQSIKIRFFEDAIKSIITYECNSEWFGNAAREYICVRSDGTYEGMDMMKVVGKNGRVIDMNVNDHSISEVSEHPDIDNLFINFDENLIAPECNTCPIYEWCGGGYLPTRFGNNRGYNNPSIYCTDLKMMFYHIGNWVANHTNIANNLKEKINNTLTNLAKSDPNLNYNDISMSNVYNS